MRRLAAMVLVLYLALTACSKKELLKKHSEADVEFVHAMMPVHEQAIHMSELAIEHANSPDTEKIAATIKSKQEEEVKTMEELLHEWGMEKGHGGEATQEMLPEEEIKELEETRGVEFDKLFLKQMIEHHHGAIKLAEEYEHEHKGENKEIEKLAAEIKRGQEHEIEEIERELVGL
jgi:uncharacterized protein (DUF305 family)